MEGVKKGYHGYVFPNDVNEWISIAIGKSVILLHAPLTMLNVIDDKASFLKEQGDAVKCFLFDGGMHILGEGSIEDLKSRVHARHPGIDVNKLKVDMINFRPNIGLKTKTPYYEDGIMEMRIGNLLIRNIGPTFRCPDTQTDYDNQRKNVENEPLATLNAYRLLPAWGCCFGIYCKMAVI